MKKIFILIISFIFVVFINILFLWKDIYINLNDSKNEINVFELYEEKGAKALYCTKLFKLMCKDVSNEIEINNNINNNVIGEYNVVYNINYKGIKKNKQKKVHVIDTTPPVITLVNNESSIACPNKDYVEDGYTSIDNYDNDITDKVSILNEIGKVTYTSIDSSNNKTIITREIKYLDKEKPVIKLKGYNVEYLLLGETYKEKGYSASDNCDGNITNKVKTSNNINNNIVGTYKVKYTVTDLNNNTSEIIRTIKVYEKQNYITVIPTGKVVYLTFDDGPCIYTKKLLDILKKYNVKATFFVTNQMGNQSYIKRQYQEGHSIGIHTYSHVYKNIYSSVDNFFNDINKMDASIYKQTGIHTKLLRFAGGSSNTISGFNKGIMTTLTKEAAIRGYVYFDWNVSSNDTGTSNVDKIVNNIINGIKSHNYSIVLQHDIKSYTPAVVERVIQYGLANGYTFLGLDITSPTAHHKVNN